MDCTLFPGSRTAIGLSRSIDGELVGFRDQAYAKESAAARRSVGGILSHIVSNAVPWFVDAAGEECVGVMQLSRDDNRTVIVVDDACRAPGPRAGGRRVFFVLLTDGERLHRQAKEEQG